MMVKHPLEFWKPPLKCGLWRANSTIKGLDVVWVVFFQIVDPGAFWTYYIHNRKVV